MKTSNNSFFGTIFIILVYTTLYGKEINWIFASFWICLI